MLGLLISKWSKHDMETIIKSIRTSINHNELNAKSDDARTYKINF